MLRLWTTTPTAEPGVNSLPPVCPSLPFAADALQHHWCIGTNRSQAPARLLWPPKSLKTAGKRVTLDQSRETRGDAGAEAQLKQGDNAPDRRRSLITTNRGKRGRDGVKRGQNKRGQDGLVIMIET